MGLVLPALLRLLGLVGNFCFLFLLQTLQLPKLLFRKVHMLFLSVFSLEAKLFHLILADFLFVIHIHYYLHKLAKHVHTVNLSLQTILSSYKITDTRKLSVELLISILFIFQATHKSAAHTGNLGGIQGQILLLGHLDRYRYKI